MKVSKTKLSLALMSAGITRTRLAELLGCSVQYVSSLCTGQRKLTPATARKIEQATQGKVAAFAILSTCELCGAEPEAPDPDDEDVFKQLGVPR